MAAAALDLRERECTYTRDAHKKRKRWLDGRLSFAPRAAGAGAVAKLHASLRVRANARTVVGASRGGR